MNPAFLLTLATIVVAQSDTPKWAEPPGEESPSIKGQIDSAAIRVRGGDLPALLIDPALMELHPYPRFRKLIEDNAPTGAIQLVGKDEPGERLELRLTMGKPNVVMYLYHTSAKGCYAQNATHIRANSGDAKHARIFGYVRSDKEGKIVIATIRPMGYPGSELPQHIHYHLKLNGASMGVGEIQFADDPRLTPAMIERSKRERAIIVKPMRSGIGWIVETAIPVT